MPGKHKKQHKTTTSRRKAKRAKKKPLKAAQKSKAVAAAVLDSWKLQELYAAMLRAHTLNQKAGRILSATHKDSSPATVGREAVLVGAIVHTLPGDSVAAVQDEFLVSLVRGDSLKSVIEQVAHGNSQQSSSPEHGGAGSQEAIAIKRGMTLAAENKGKPNVVLVFPGEYGTGESAHEALNIAAKDKLPLVCVAEKASSNAEEQHDGASSVGVRNFPRIAVDGNDVVAIFRVAQEAIRRARAGHGPSLIECVMPDKRHAHPAEEIPATLLFMQQYLERRRLWSEERQQKIAQEFRLQLDATIAETSGARSKFDHIDESNRSAARSPQRLEFSEFS